VLKNVTSSQLDDPTPCKSWTVRELINHIVGGAFFFATVAETEEMPHDDIDPDFAEGDFQAAFAQGSQRALTAFNQEGAMDRTVELPSGKISGSQCMWRAAREFLVHGWDLATSTGQLIAFDNELAEGLLHAPAGDIPDDLRGEEPKPFALRVDIGDDAPTLSRLVAYMGRVP
jgi:uncharacterized protein (TIGR03086 family)